MSNKLYVDTPNANWLLPFSVNGELTINNKSIFKGYTEYTGGTSEYNESAVEDYDMNLIVSKKRITRDTINYDLSQKVDYYYNPNYKDYKCFLYVQIEVTFDKDFVRYNSSQFYGNNRISKDHFLIHATKDSKEMMKYLNELLDTEIHFEK